MKLRLEASTSQVLVALSPFIIIFKDLVAAGLQATLSVEPAKVETIDK